MNRYKYAMIFLKISKFDINYNLYFKFVAIYEEVISKNFLFNYY